MNWREYIHTDKSVLVGKPIIIGTRLSVDFILNLLSEGWTEEKILENYPQLSHKSLQAIFSFTAEIISEESLFIFDNQAA